MKQRVIHTCPSAVPKAKVSFNGFMVRLMKGEEEIIVDWYSTELLLISQI